MANDEGVATLSIHDYMDFGLNVFDVNSKKIGTITAYEPTLGYMIVRPHPVSTRFLHIPFHTITHIDPREVFIADTRESAHRLYHDPPPRSTLLRERNDPITGEEDSEAITSEPSGYDGLPVVVDEVAVGKLAHHLAPGFRVVSSELEELGSITSVDRAGGRMLIKEDFPSRQVHTVPLAFLEFVDREDRAVYLAVSSADLQRHAPVAIETSESEQFAVRTKTME